MRHCMMNNPNNNDNTTNQYNSMELGDLPPLPPYAENPDLFPFVAEPIAIPPDNNDMFQSPMQNMASPNSFFPININENFIVEAPSMPSVPMVSPSNMEYFTDYLQSQIDRVVKLEFIVGTNKYIERVGILKEVAADYVVIQELAGNNTLVCDLHSIKFVSIYPANDGIRPFSSIRNAV